MDSTEFQRPRIAVSACLLGKPVRYDGGHKRDGFISDKLSRVTELEPVCLELLDVFLAYRESESPLATPLVLVQHHLHRHPVPYLERQHYLQPYPSCLGLRAHL